MTRERLDDVLDAFYRQGWVLLNQEEHPDASRDPYVLEEETIEWALSSEQPDGRTRTIELAFWATSFLGGPTRDLRDLVYCTLCGTDIRLTFSKRGGTNWKKDLAEFVDAVTKVVQSESH